MPFQNSLIAQRIYIYFFIKQGVSVHGKFLRIFSWLSFGQPVLRFWLSEQKIWLTQKFSKIRMTNLYPVHDILIVLKAYNALQLSSS